MAPGLTLRLSELVASLSLGTDLGMGQPEGQALRTSLLALGVAQEMGLDRQVCADVSCRHDEPDEALQPADILR